MHGFIQWSWWWKKQLPHTAFDFVASNCGFANYIAALARLFNLWIFSQLLLHHICSADFGCCSMCAWFIVRVKNRISNILYYLFVFSMVVPFPDAYVHCPTNTLGLILLSIFASHLGFGAGLAVFMFAQTIPLEIGNYWWLQSASRHSSKIVYLLKPTTISILETSWVGMTICFHILFWMKTKLSQFWFQYFRGGYGRVEMGPMFAYTSWWLLSSCIYCANYIIDVASSLALAKVVYYGQARHFWRFINGGNCLKRRLSKWRKSVSLWWLGRACEVTEEGVVAVQRLPRSTSLWTVRVGKSTLHMIAGLEDISAGELVDVADRDIAMVFQSYALSRYDRYNM